MPKRSSNPRDLNQLAARLVQKATTDGSESDPYEGKNLAAVELGRLGGKKGGKARAAKLNFCRVHESLTIKVEGGKSIKRTPAMAAGIADYPWSLTQLAGLLD